MARGRFYVVEGADGVGSSTQCQRLVDRLTQAQRTVHLTAEPSTGPIGKVIRVLLGGDRPRQAINSELALLFGADRLDHVAREIEPRLQEGIDIVSDRYVLSSLVYQSLDLPLEWVRELNKYAPSADATVLISLPIDEAWARLEKRIAEGAAREVFDVRTTQSRVHAEYGRLARRMNGAIVVDGSGSVDEVANRVEQALKATNCWPR